MFKYASVYYFNFILITVIFIFSFQAAISNKFQLYIRSTFTIYAITRKILQQSALIFVGTFGTLGQHEFAYGFCGSIGVEVRG